MTTSTTDLPPLTLPQGWFGVDATSAQARLIIVVHRPAQSPNVKRQGNRWMLKMFKLQTTYLHFWEQML